MEKSWKEKNTYIILCIAIILLLLITIMASKDEKNRQKFVKDSVLNQDIYEIRENLGSEGKKDRETNCNQILNKNNTLTSTNTNITNESNKTKEENKRITQTEKVTSKPKQTSKPMSTPKTTSTPRVTSTPSPVEIKNTKTAQTAINEMKVGWNLGNSLDSCNYQKKYIGQAQSVSYYETLWGNSQTTKEMINEIKKAGFGSVRVPVTYYDHINALIVFG